VVHRRRRSRISSTPWPARWRPRGRSRRSS
jgi:hypothetical protein